jgi:predicted permease
VAVTPSLARGLGVDPMIGTWFEDDSGLVISYRLWQRLGSSAAIVGQLLSLDGRPYTVTGVMPPAFQLPVAGPGVGGAPADVWMRLDPLGKGQNQYGLNFAYGKLKPGVAFSQAEADAKRVAAEIAALDPADHPSYTAKLDSLRETVILEIKPTLQLLTIAAGVLLLITCADVAGLLLTRSIARARETAIRVALGAARRQLALHYVFEGLTVAIAGAVGGILFSMLLVRSVLSIAADHIPRAGDISLDPRVVLFAMGTALAASFATSLAPLWQATKTTPSAALNEGVRASASAVSRRLSRSLVVAELALAFVQLTTSAVLIEHLWNLRRVHPGFDSEGLLTFAMALRDNDDDEASARVVAHERLTSAIESIAGVTSAAFGSQLPLAGCCFSTAVFPDGRPAQLEQVARTNLVTVTPGFFRTMAIPLRSGRLLDSRDTGREPLRVLVNEAAARVNWPAQNAVGAHGRLGAPDGTRFQIVGVVGDIRNDGLGKPVVPALYLLSAVLPLQPVTFFVRSSLPPQTLVPEIRRKISEVDPTRPIYDVAPMPAVVAESMSLPRVGSFMTGFFALAALLMATLGIYGVVSYGVRQATVEIGTRMALGAIGRDLLLMIVGSGLKMAAVGIALGGIAMIGAAWLVVRLFEIQHLGVLPFIVSGAIVALVSSAASFFPAWRATTVSPMVAIRNEPGAEWRLTRESLRDAFTRVSRAIAAPDPAQAEASSTVTAFVAAARGARSYSEAFDTALATLRTLMRAESVRLLEKIDDQYRDIAAPLDALSVPADGFLVRRLRWYLHPLPFTDTDLDGLIAWAGDRTSRGAEFRRLADAGVRMAVALRARDEILGLLLLGAPMDRNEYSAEDRRVLAQCADHLTLMIENARLTTRVVEQEKLRRDVALAAEVQRRLLPERPPDAAGAALAAMSLPARTVGGDYYDFLDLGDHRIGVALADVAGKGVAAALIMAVVQATLRIAAAEKGTSLPALAAKLNEFLHRSTRSNSYATFFYAQLDERSRELRYVNAGHNPPFLLRRVDGNAAGAAAEATEIVELKTGGTVLGLFPEMAYEEAVVNLRSGDVLVAFTDGVTEALNAADEEFGEARLKALLQRAAHLSAAEISAQIAGELRSWIRSTDQYDDLTFVVLKVQ